MPTLVCHADWGTSPHKRWIARADLDGGHYEARAPELVGDHLTLISRTREGFANASVLFGFDFPIGIPAAYAASIGVTNFREFMVKLGTKEWTDFYGVCGKASEVSAYRPFYPFRPGGTSHKHLLSALGVNCIDDLRRQCELKTAERNAACPLFWTLGANQVGKGAIVGWRDVITPALENDSAVKLWPFDGVLRDLLRPGNLVIAETYPAESCRWLIGKPLKGKGKLEVRKSASTDLFRWAQKRGVRLHPDLKQVIEHGFPEGDDAFDAVIGLFGMLEVVLGHRATGEPRVRAVNDIEGWILGQLCA
jgi:hypothetical protein